MSLYFHTEEGLKKLFNGKIKSTKFSDIFLLLYFLSLILLSSCEITVSPNIPPYVTDIKISSLPIKNVYHIGESVDYTGLKVSATYSDGSEKEITDYTLSLEDGTILSKEQTYTIEIKYKEFSQSFTIEVLPIMIGIKIASLPKKLTYYVGEPIDYTGLEIAEIYSDGTIKEIADYTLSLGTGTILSKEQSYTIEVQYKSFSQTFTIDVLPVITGIKIASLPKKTTYYIGETIDYDGLKISETYSDGSVKETTNYTLSLENGTILSKEQTYVIEVQYNGFSQTFNIEVLPVITGIQILSLPLKITYYVGDSVNYDGLKVAVTYSNGTEEEITNYEISLKSGTVLSKEQTCIITVQYKDFSQSFNIEILPIMTGIKITSLPNKTVYYDREAIDYTGLKISETYSDGTEKEITDYTLSLKKGSILTSKQINKIEVNYKGFSQTFNIDVLPVITGLNIKSLPEKTVYYVGETVNYAGLKITASYSDDSEKEITDYTLSLHNGTPLAKEENYVINVQYEGYSQAFTIEVLPVMTGIKLLSLPLKTTYYVGDSVNYNGLKIAATYSNGNEKEITDYTLSFENGATLSKEQTYKIEVQYKEFSQFFNIEVLPVMTGIKIASLPAKTVYYDGESFNYDGLKISLTYSDKTEKEITDYTVSLPNGTILSSKQNYTIEVLYKNFSKAFNIEVLPVMTGIKVLSLPLKTTYYVGECINYDGLKILATYSDGSEKQLTNYTLSFANGTTLSKEQTYTIEVQYNEFSQNFNIEVLPVMTGIKITSLPEKTVYHVSESVDYTGLKIAATYSDSHEEEITGYTLSLNNGSILTRAQTYTVKIQYNGFSASFNIEILPNLVNVIQVTLPEHFDVENLLSYEEDNHNFIAKAGFTEYIWWLDSEKLSNKTAIYSLNTSSLFSGYHSLMILVKTADGERFSATATINILREER